MTIEITHKSSGNTYRINADNPQTIDKRENKHGARWQFVGRYSSPEQARDALFAIEQLGTLPIIGMATVQLSVPDTIRAAMRPRLLRQKDLARELSISEQYLSDILQGRRGISVYVALQLERVLELNARELLIAQVDDDLVKAKETQ